MKIDEIKLRRLITNLLKEATGTNENVEDIRAAAEKGLADLDQAQKDAKDTSKRLKSKSEATPAALKKIVDGAKKAGEGKEDMEKMKAELRYYSLRGVTFQLRNGKGTYTIKTLDGETTTLSASDVGAAPSEEIKKAAEASKKVSQAASKASKKSSKSSGGGSAAKIKNIQKIVGTEVDGKWGGDTTEKWKAWISSEEGMRGVAALAKEKGVELKESKTIKRLELRSLLETSAFFPYLNEEEEPEESNVETADTESDSESTAAGKDPKIEIPGTVKDYIEKNKGSAATIAKALGYTGNLSGVNQLANDIKSKTANTGESENTDEPPGESDSDTGLFLDKVNEIDPKAVWLKCIPADSKNFKLKTNETYPFVAGYSKITEKDVDDLNSKLNKFLARQPQNPAAKGLPGVLGRGSISGIAAPAFVINLSLTKSMEILFIDGSGTQNYALKAKYSKKTIGGKDYYVLGDSDKNEVPESYKEKEEAKNESLRMINILKKHKLL